MSSLSSRINHKRNQLANPIPRRSDTLRGAEVSLNQEELAPPLFVDSALNRAYTIGTVGTFHGPLQLSALGKSFNNVIDRHMALRTRFNIESGHVVQEVLQTPEVGLSVTDISTATVDEQHAIINSAIESIMDGGVTPQADLPFHATIFRRNPEEHYLFLAINHLNFDAWSFRVLWDELGQFYRKHSTGTTIVPTRPALQFSDFSAWQRRWVDTSEAQTQLKYWQDRLRDCPEGVTFTPDVSQHELPTTNSSSYSWTIEQTLPHRIAEKATRIGVSRAAVLLSALQLQLCEETGKKDIVVGVPFANRGRSPAQEAIGFFANTHAVRVVLPDSGDLEKSLSLASASLSGAMLNEEIPLGYVLRESYARGDLTQFPERLFRVLFICRSFRWNPPNFGDVYFTPDNRNRVNSGSSMLDFVLAIDFEDQDIRCTINYNRQIYSSNQIGSIALRYEQIIHTLCANV